MTGRERVVKTLEFDRPDRAPRDLWWLQSVAMSQKEELERLLEMFPIDFGIPHFKPGRINNPTDYLFVPLIRAGGSSRKPLPRNSKYIDEWGSVWWVAEDGMAGEVREPVIDDLLKVDNFSPPWDYLNTIDLSDVNKSCAESNKFMLSDVCARPFERLQFLRGTENFFIDLGYGCEEIYRLRDIVHEYNMKYIKMWLETDVDGVFLMDDWGAQQSLLISPTVWREFLKPLYKEYCDLIHYSNKYVFFHSDGFIEEIFADVIEIGIDAINSQLFCMDIEKISKQYKGKITFWGEIDRQKIIPFGNVEDIRNAVFRLRKAFDDENGGVIAQCEWGKNVPVENIEEVYNSWSKPVAELARLTTM